MSSVFTPPSLDPCHLLHVWEWLVVPMSLSRTVAHTDQISEAVPVRCISTLPPLTPTPPGCLLFMLFITFDINGCSWAPLRPWLETPGCRECEWYSSGSPMVPGAQQILAKLTHFQMCALRWEEGGFLEAEGEGKKRVRGGWRAKEGPDEEGKLILWGFWTWPKELESTQDFKCHGQLGI